MQVTKDSPIVRVLKTVWDNNGPMYVSDIARKVGITKDHVRRDVSLLAVRGVLRKKMECYPGHTDKGRLQVSIGARKDAIYLLRRIYGDEVGEEE